MEPHRHYFEKGNDTVEPCPAAEDAGMNRLLGDPSAIVRAYTYHIGQLQARMLGSSNMSLPLCVCVHTNTIAGLQLQ